MIALFTSQTNLPTMAAFRAATRQIPFRRTLFTQTPQIRTSPLKTGIYTTAFVISAGLFAVYYFDARSAIHRYFFTPLLRHTLDAETGHKVAVKVLRSGFGPKDPVSDDETLQFEVCVCENHGLC